ncbi:uncharacterized protein LOC128204982 [Mya arenaria]|uniref:uncharacterized protein LOC128204982 n=1 Tax=Mya arenaria TaxID=6604 RepID=UPI0022DFA792|nr:uncharacterized protein LOC128204982 [Mya arenaria]
MALRTELQIQMANKPSAAEETAHTDSNQKPGTISSQMRLLVPKRAANGEVVAFHANLRANTCFQSQEIIVFDNVVTNTMTAYDPLDGIFTAPVTGTYVFIWNFGSFGRSYNIIELVVHGTGIGSSISDS